MPRPKGIVKELTEDEKKRIRQMKDEGCRLDDIAKELHRSPNKVQEYIKSIGMTDGKKHDRSKDDNNVLGIEDMLEDGFSVADIASVMELSDAYVREVKRAWWKRKNDEASYAEYDLTTNSKEDNDKLVDEIIMELGTMKAGMLTFKTNEEVTLGGERMESGKMVVYETKKHVFDIVIPELKIAIVTIEGKQMLDAWRCMLGNKKDPKIPTLSYFGLLRAVAGYEIINGTDVKELKNRISAEMMFKHMDVSTKESTGKFIGCIDCIYKEECCHTYCKVRGEKEKPPLDLEKLREKKYRGILSSDDNISQWSNHVDEEFAKVNMDEYKYWDKMGRIGKEKRPALQGVAFTEATGGKNEEATLDVITNSVSKYKVRKLFQ